MDVEDYVRSVLKHPTRRDLQTTVGPSMLGSPCTRCLADAMLNGQYEGKSPYWLGAVNGTAIHAYFGTRAEELQEALGVAVEVEQSVVVGDLPGYGTIKGSIDLYIPAERLVVDVKTTSRTHLAAYKRIALENDQAESLNESRMQLNTYINQVTLYGRGKGAEKLALVFVCRDGSGDNDIWAYPFDYDPELSDRIWNRAAALWAWLQEADNDPNQLDSHQFCWYCNNLRPTKKEVITL